MTARAHPVQGEGYPPAFVAEVLDDALAHGSRVFGIAGLQGTGKTTLAKQMVALGRRGGLCVAVLSLDDFYFGRRERQRLGRTVHPLLATRGPPGTHDLALACATIDGLVAGRTTPLPHFDKIADRRMPPSRWALVTRRSDLILLDGWFLKVPPEPDAALSTPLNALERDEDPHGIWRAYCNEALAGYAPVWQRIDRMWFLQGPGFEIVPTWRWQQEQTLQATHPGRTVMTRTQVERFVLFFERVSRQALRMLPAIADRTARVDAHRHPLP